MRLPAWFALGLCAALGACSGLEGGASTGEGDAPGPDRLLEDENVLGGEGVTADRVQGFLADEGSALAGYAEEGASAAQLIVDAARAEGVSPVYLLARIQTESGLVRSGSLERLRSATGCGCPDGERCDPAFANFGPQVRCAARLVRSYFDDLDARGQTVTGWAVGVTKQTADGCPVAPANRATAALYTYTPWVGAYAKGCGSKDVGGASLVGVIYRQYARELGG
ncbi:MAG TPA: hypothetical protein VFS00_22340 [Polyangiaceae bacterium]|nr:hypothetical protein [Polyangiaceae bacterium]